MALLARMIVLSFFVSGQEVLPIEGASAIGYVAYVRAGLMILLMASVRMSQYTGTAVRRHVLRGLPKVLCTGVCLLLVSKGLFILQHGGQREPCR
jgi:hypothetical protein